MNYVDSKNKLKVFLKYESQKYGLKNSSYPIITLKERKLLYKFNYLLRKLEYFSNCNKRIRKIITQLLYLRLERKYSIFLPINVFDKGLKLIHIGPRLVNANSIVGKNCVLHINTNIVAGGVNNFAPKIGDDCILGVGSIILGNAEIGNNTAVGAGAIVNKSFKEGNMTLAGVPAKKVSNKTREDWSEDKRKKVK